MTKNLKQLMFCLALVVLLPGCSSVKKELGVGRQSPDEFMVVKRAPLTLPPDYALRPPSSDSAPPASEAANQAKAALLGTSGETTEKGTAEDALLGKMGATNPTPDIRDTINRENGYMALKNRTLVDKLVFWNDTPPTDEATPASVVNAQQEAERLKKNQEEGKPANTGDVPVIEKKQSTFEKIF